MKFVMLPLKNKIYDAILLYNESRSSSNIGSKGRVPMLSTGWVEQPTSYSTA